MKNILKILVSAAITTAVVYVTLLLSKKSMAKKVKDEEEPLGV